MTKLSINLPFARRLDLHLVRDKSLLEEPLLPKIKSVLKVKKGSKFSRIFGRIFENKKIKKLAGKGLLLMFVVTPLLPQSSYAISVNESESIQSVSAPFILETKKGIQYPTENIKMTTKYSFFHPGIDLDGLTGDPIHAVLPGRVESVSYSRIGYGNAVMINHGSGTQTFYAHLSRVYVNSGDEVTTESIIGLMGATGRAFGDHLHFEVFENGKRINPLLILPKQLTPLAQK